MKNKLKDIENKIFFGDHSDDEWKEIKKSLDEEFPKSTDKEKKEFVDSGAGNLLAQILEYME